jgi:hypothetical protein
LEKEWKNFGSKFQGVVTNKGKPSYLIFGFGTGVKPNSEIASDAGIKLGINKA